MRIAFLALFLALASISDARLGETAIQFADRYGAPKENITRIADKTSPLIAGAIHHTYQYQGWKIRAAFLQLDGPAVRMDFQKLGGTGTSIVIQDYELQAIITANTAPEMSWKPMIYDDPSSSNKGLAKVAEGFLGDATGQKMWQRTDGAILWLRSNLVVRLELPAARQYEAQMKAAREQKAALQCRASRGLRSSHRNKELLGYGRPLLLVGPAAGRCVINLAVFDQAEQLSLR